jgi:putative effector of murein hydrolase LrgA (UPF0299 family)
MASYRIITIPAKWFNLTLLSTCVGAIILLFTALVSIVLSLYVASEGVLLILAHVSSAQLIVMQVIGLSGYALLRRYNKWRKEGLA